MFWKDTEKAEDAKILQDRMWGLVQTVSNNRIEFRVRGEGLFENGGEFWFDALRNVRSDPNERLRIAQEHLPLPGAFQEAAVALRSIIREKRASKADYLPELGQLYHLAAVWSFYIPYAPRLKRPGYNVMARVPFSEFRSMKLTWDAIGYSKLELLTKTDRRLMAAAWGEPKMHVTAHELYQAVWDRYESMLIQERAPANRR
jgi:hypothetical protein